MNWKNIKLFGKPKQSELNAEIPISEFEKIIVFKSLPKDQWKSAYKELNTIIGLNLKPYGFKKKGRKHYRLTNDLLEVIDIDNRGSWTGLTDNLKIRIGLVPFCRKGLIDEYYLVGSKRIEEIDKTIRKHFRLSQEYLLLADYLSDRIITNILPFFDKYNSTYKIISQPYIFPYDSKCGGADINNSHLLILFSELKQHLNRKASEIMKMEISYHKHIENDEIVNEWTELKKLTESENWTEIDKIFAAIEKEELDKLKIKASY